MGYRKKLIQVNGYNLVNFLRHVQARAACLDEQALTTRSFPFRAGSLPTGRGAAEQGDGQPQA